MKTITVTLTKMLAGGGSAVKEFSDYTEAYNYFASKADELGYDYEHGGEEIDREAGGIGHDYRLELEVK